MTSPQSACVWIRHALLRTRTKDERSAREKKVDRKSERGGGGSVSVAVSERNHQRRSMRAGV